MHHLHNEKDRGVLSYRVDAEGREPWTWIRTHGQDRVFYTDWGHDRRTWRNPGFQNLVERGIRWAAGQDPSVAAGSLADRPFPVPEMTAKRTDDQPFEFIRSTNNNTWGLGVSEEGIIFGSTANRVPRVYMPIPHRYYEGVKGWTSSLVLDSIAENHLFDPITENVRLSRQELTDLREFLTKRGSFHPLDFSDVATIASDRGMFHGGDGRGVGASHPTGWTALVAKLPHPRRELVH